MAGKREDLVGKSFQGCVVLSFDHVGVSRHLFWRCRCRRGRIKVVSAASLKKTPGCGCTVERHRMRYTRFYRIWIEIRHRSKRHPAYQHVDVRWKTFAAFKHDMYVSYLHHVARHGETNTSIDRRDNEGPYSKKNCRWATRIVQGNNQRSNRRITFRGVTRTVTQWARALKVSDPTLFWRLNHWPVERALTAPLRQRR